MISPTISVSDFKELRVLVLEDHAFQRNLLVNVLNHLGITTVLSAGDGQTALDILAQASCEIDVAICDLRMEGMDGIEFIRHASSLKVRSFLITSAVEVSLLASAETVVRSYGTRLLGVLPKPINIERLKNLLEECISAKPSSDPVEPREEPALHSEAVIFEALMQNQFYPVFLPKFGLDTNLPNGVEMRSRWAHPTLGTLTEDAFMPSIEAAGLTERFFDTLVPVAMSCANTWMKVGFDIGLAVDVPLPCLQNPDFPLRMINMARGQNIAANRLTLEVSEAALSENGLLTIASLTRLRMQGFKISVDNFGIGYASLQQLTDMPFSEVKLDQSFTKAATESKRSTLIAESIVTLAKKLDFHTVAQGVETREEFDFIKALGFETAQGGILAKPMNLDEILEFLTSVRRHK